MVKNSWRTYSFRGLHTCEFYLLNLLTGSHGDYRGKKKNLMMLAVEEEGNHFEHFDIE